MALERGTDPASLAGKKRPRIGAHGGADLKRVAEIVMVLSAVGEMRGGLDPTAAEKAMAAEARGILAGMCEELKPKDLFSRDAVRVVFEDLGLNRSKNPLHGCRPPKMSIADKLLLTKKRMEEQKELSTLHSPLALQATFGLNSESHGSVFHGAPRFFPERPTIMALSAGGFQNASPEVHVPDLASATTSLKQPYVYETQPSATIMTTSTNPLVKDSPPLSLPRSEAAHFRLDARSTVSTTIKLGQENKLPNHTLVMSEGVHEGNAFQSSHQAMKSRSMQASVIQNAPGNLLIGHQPSQTLTYANETSYLTNHNEIAKNVQGILQQKVSSHPNWTLPSVDYMKKPLTCQLCKILIIDVESLLVCDACELGTHLKCLQPNGNKEVPKAEWYCQKCVIASSGKAYPPKYGRVTRSIAISKASSDTVGTHASPEKRADNPDLMVKKVLVPNIESASDSKATSSREMQGVGLLSARVKREDGMHSRPSTYPSKEMDLIASATSGTQSESSSKQVESRGLSSSDMQTLTHESILDSENVSDQACSNYHNETSEAAHSLEALSDPQVCNEKEFMASAEASDPNANELNLCELGPKHESDNDVRPCDQVNSQVVPNGASDRGDTAVGCQRLSPLDSRTVNWVGDVLEAVEDKTYYQSCCINGALHKLQDHVLISSNNLFPSKLQSLWEDKKTGTKWVTVETYYFPSDLPEVVNRPSTPENNEVYASINRSTMMASLIRGPCKVLTIDKFREESNKRIQLGDTNNSLHPFFLCRWLYDEAKDVFQAVTN